MVEEDLDDTIIRLVEPAPPPLPSSERATFPSSVSTVDPVAKWSVRVRGTSTIVALDRPVDIGRSPGLSRIDEHPAPRRVVIPADQGEVSARHVRVEQVGETIVVYDLGSTNGVVVHWASGASRRLRRGESIAVLSDAVIVLADGVELDFVEEVASTAG